VAFRCRKSRSAAPAAAVDDRAECVDRARSARSALDITLMTSIFGILPLARSHRETASEFFAVIEERLVPKAPSVLCQVLRPRTGGSLRTRGLRGATCLTRTLFKALIAIAFEEHLHLPARWQAHIRIHPPCGRRAAVDPCSRAHTAKIISRSPRPLRAGRIHVRFVSARTKIDRRFVSWAVSCRSREPRHLERLAEAAPQRLRNGRGACRLPRAPALHPG
jgi:hypothetical protein